MKGMGIFQATFGQEYEKMEAEYSMLTFDAIMGVLGGYSALIWSCLGVLVGWY